MKGYDMNNISKTIIWKNTNSNIIRDSFPVSCESTQKVRELIIDALNNKPNKVLQVDWSRFGEDGDCIIIEDSNKN